MATVRIDPDAFRPADLAPAVQWIRQHLVVAFPTETLYGLAVNPSDTVAVETLFALKGRDPRVAVPLVAASLAQVEGVCGTLTGASAHLARAFWPGPLSLVLDAPAEIVPAAHGGAGTVAVRVPSHSLARALADACGHMLTATSANVSGQPAAASAAALGPLADDFRLFVIDGGPTAGGAPSTIVDARGGSLRLVREGAVAWSRVLESLQK